MDNKSNGPILNGLPAQVPDIDPEETREWLDSLDGVVKDAGPERARYIMLSLIERAREKNVGVPNLVTTDYINTIAPENEPWFPGDEQVERRYRSWNRWNAAMLVHRAQRPGIEVGGHISTYASAATLYEVGLNHFFRGKDHPGGGDHIFFQGHASPGMYARSLLEGRMSEDQLDGFRQQVSHRIDGKPFGMPSYPHPRQLPNFWEHPTVSMGLGPMNAIAQAQFDRYLMGRGIKDTSQQHTWAFLGDGEMDEPESRGMLQTAAYEGLDNLTFVINCNLQRLDGPVRGNGKIIQELEAQFHGAGWNVIKVIWGREWDDLLARDRDGALVNLMNQTPDGDYQTYKGESGGFVRDNFFGRDPRTKAMVEEYTDAQIWGLKRGGHDYRKVYAAYKAAMEHKGQPTVILVKTVKGYSLGPHFEARNATHQMKKLTIEDLKLARDHFNIPISDKQLEENPKKPPYYNPGPDAPEVQYLRERRRELGGFVPERRSKYTQIKLPDDKDFKVGYKGSGKQKIATTMGFVRVLKDLMRDKEFGKRIVPIIPDEARTFGMDSFFPTAKIYNPHGQNYISVDRDLFLAYKEATDGQLLHMGINESGSTAAFTAAGTSYATHGEPMIPFYIFYSMFGFQRSGDGFWAAGDQMARGFILGATAGRTTLVGEGLQHGDGHSHILSSTFPSIVSYDPAYVYEIAHIVRDGLHRMYDPADSRDPNVSYYITMYNEPMVQPPEPEGLDVDGLLKGLYKLKDGPAISGAPKAQLMASGVGVPWILQAQQMLAEDWGVSADVWSVTSWQELRRDGLTCDDERLLHPEAEPRVPFVAQQLAGADGPVIATSDFSRGVPDMIRQYVPNHFVSLGADDYAISDTRPAARRHYLIDAASVVVQTLISLADLGLVDSALAAQATKKYKLDDPTAGDSGSTEGSAA
ncbi:pyruvate dehydrogenase (acetyl-transferring), homodimeric type [Brevibacterium sp. 50QC2O2]|uniref:pyruvate dehydrogenase (acetyl-transferring), homodimeric type n=1 Tax=Brevibacterium TaxID=1696 RepID=UPI00211C60E4|nr:MULTISPECIES: pyruvate dehydrogenase (acetyl-transferring), homodimeric type [unclassified Brevibacterium]MCQ9366634.1 pyruvate dehydrogenase (acetyl-transferring), homodimeric type [Brevibacterium sp. 91QC2O2]MCQ9384484.1 pyruvate dehydrogenase (acetyl-transferring), homodimeric type [Brevibacterium sp. 68QC2CO]MCQ9389626.1 pyruvate dehydrogenase (acetyl-transferring), homodimeric type [Brevibacterium sp. 50QC2O2]